MDNNVVTIIVSILSGLAACIPLVIQLVKYVKKSVEEKNWNQLLNLVTNLMEEAEKKFATGAERKEWVLAMANLFGEKISFLVIVTIISPFSSK